MTIEQLFKRINATAFLKESQLHVDFIEEGHATGSMTINEAIRNPHGYAHGGAMYSLADVVAGAAAASLGRSVVTLNGSMNNIKPGKGTILYADAKVISHGGHTAVVDVRVTNDMETLIATANFTMYFVDETKYDHKK